MEQKNIIFEGVMYKILFKDDGHYLVTPPGDKSTLSEGMDIQTDFFKKIIAEYFDKIKHKIKDHYEQNRTSKFSGLRIGVNFGSAGQLQTPHLHFFPIVEGEEFIKFGDQKVKAK